MFRNLAIKARNLLRYASYYQDYFKFRRAHDGRFTLNLSSGKACLRDRTSNTGFDRHYIYHVSWAARILQLTKPTKHVDISSTLYFSSIVSAFIPTDFYDFRPAPIELSGLGSYQADLMKLPFVDNSIPSLSCMHTVEHVGLGRYGDPIDPKGDLRAITELSRVLADDGNLLFVVPIGKPRIVFNAHRIYSYDQIISYFPKLILKQFALIPDNPSSGGLIIDANKALADQQTYGCGCFWFKK